MSVKIAAKEKPAEAQLQAFFAKYAPSVSALGKALLAKMRKRLPGAVELVYDNYNALVIAFSATERAADAIFSLALYPRWVNLFFAHGADLPDPHGLLAGDGKTFRHVMLGNAADFDKPALKALMSQAMKNAGKLPEAAQPGRIVIKSVSERQRARRPPNPRAAAKIKSGTKPD